MRILFHDPAPDSIYAGRTIFFGYKHAFEDLGHEFKALTPNLNQEKVFQGFKPHIFFTSLSMLNLKFLNLDLIKKQKEKGLKIFVNLPFWKSPMSKLRINETPSISEVKEWVRLITSGDFGDVYYNICEQGDLRMKGFEKTTGYKYYSIPLAADKIILFPERSEGFKADIAFIGTYLPTKREFFKKYVFPLKKKFRIRLYGQDWTPQDRLLGWIQRVGQYLNIPYIKSLKKQPLQLEDERKIYSSSIISINVHENYQRKFGGDCNERTFKIPLCGGFEIVDDVNCIKTYFKDGKDMVIARNMKDWFDKIEYYIEHPEKRIAIINAGRKRVLRDHTYHNRVDQIIKIYNTTE